MASMLVLVAVWCRIGTASGGEPSNASAGEPRSLESLVARLPTAGANGAGWVLPGSVELGSGNPAVQLAGFSESGAGGQSVAQPSGNTGIQYLPDPRPEVLRAPREPLIPADETPPINDLDGSLLRYSQLAPSGFTGPSGILPREGQESSHFVPLEDRWRSGFPEWDRYGRGHPILDDYPYVEGNKWNSYKQNVLKGDYPIVGQHTFLSITATSQSIAEFRQVPTPTTPFESTTNPNQNDFFGKPNQFFYTHNFSFSVDLSHGDAAFKPADWRIRLTPVFNLNDLSVQELGIVSPDVTQGTTRFRTDFALQEWFGEVKLADLSPDYDFMSVRAGSQQFNSDFRGFVFNDTNRAVRLFGTRLANRDQFNAIYFDQTEKDTNSFLNTFADRHRLS